MIITHPNIRSKTTSGFTLLELIGVMVVISILLAAAIPLTISILQSKRLTDEKAELPRVAEALKIGMLREQIFPIYDNAISKISEDVESNYWWNLAARHGGGSATECRYPVGSRNATGNVRKLYFSDATLQDEDFSGITQNGLGWLNSFQDPLELRLIIVSTVNPDLPLPDTVSRATFDAFWDDWSLGNDGNPAIGAWVNYGLDPVKWNNRAAELVLQRVDLREWLCELTVEIRSGINLNTLGFMPFSLGNVEETVDLRRVELTNVSNAKPYLARTSETSGSPPETTHTIESLVIDGQPTVELKYENGKFEEATPALRLLDASGAEVETITLDRLQRNPTFGFQPTDSAIQSRYFLLNETISLFDASGTDEVGVLVLDAPFKSIRFNGYYWEY